MLDGISSFAGVGCCFVYRWAAIGHEQPFRSPKVGPVNVCSNRIEDGRTAARLAASGRASAVIDLQVKTETWSLQVAVVDDRCVDQWSFEPGGVKTWEID